MERAYCQNATCGKRLPVQVGRGRKRRYCDDACQQEAYRTRHERHQEPQKRNTVLRKSNHLDLIFCAGDNRAFFEIAREAGYLLGIRSGRTSYGFPIRFVDIEYRKPNFEKHLRVVMKYRPKYASVLDLSEECVSQEDIARALDQYAQLSPYCQIPLIIPKLPGQIALLPPDIAVGYSVPTRYGGAQYSIAELQGRRVHLLGGSPHEQMDLYKRLDSWAEVISADGNMAMRIARDFSKYWDEGVWVNHPEKGISAEALHLDCWRRSCQNICRAWRRLADLASEEGSLSA